MKKNNRVLRIGLLALVLTLVTASLVSGTFAKYVTTVSGTGTVQVANWAVVLKESATVQTANFDIDLRNTAAGIGDVDQTGLNAKTVRIAPGTSGSFSLTYNTAGTEVDHAIALVLTKESGTFPTNLKFTATADGTSVSNFDVSNYTYSKPIAFDADSKTGTVVVNWEWPFVTTNGDKTDTDQGKVSSTYDFTLKAAFSATQTND